MLVSQSLGRFSMSIGTEVPGSSFDPQPWDVDGWARWGARQDTHPRVGHPLRGLTSPPGPSPTPGPESRGNGLQRSHRGRDHVPCIRLGRGHGPFTPGDGAAGTGLVRVKGSSTVPVPLAGTLALPPWHGGGAPRGQGECAALPHWEDNWQDTETYTSSWGICLSSCEVGVAIVTGLTHHTQLSTPAHSQTGRQSWPTKQARDPGQTSFSSST